MIGTRLVAARIGCQAGNLILLIIDLAKMTLR